MMASGPITSGQTDGQTVETGDRPYFLAPKSLQMVTADMKLKDAYSLEGKLLKSRDITLPTKGCLVKAVVFPVAMYGCDCGLDCGLDCEES